MQCVAYNFFAAGKPAVFFVLVYAHMYMGMPDFF